MKGKGIWSKMLTDFSFYRCCLTLSSSIIYVCFPLLELLSRSSSTCGLKILITNINWWLLIIGQYWWILERQFTWGCWIQFSESTAVAYLVRGADTVPQGSVEFYWNSTRDLEPLCPLPFSYLHFKPGSSWQVRCWPITAPQLHCVSEVWRFCLTTKSTGQINEVKKKQQLLDWKAGVSVPCSLLTTYLPHVRQHLLIADHEKESITFSSSRERDHRIRVSKVYMFVTVTNMLLGTLINCF